MAHVEYWYCNRCGSVFTADRLVAVEMKNRHFWLDGSPMEVMYQYYCPDCGCSYLGEAAYCDDCGEPYNPDDLDDGLCEECKKKAEK